MRTSFIFLEIISPLSAFIQTLACGLLVHPLCVLLFLFMFPTIKYLQNLFPFHKGGAIYTPLQSEVGRTRCRWGRADLHIPLLSFVHPLKSSRFISIYNMFSQDAPAALEQIWCPPTHTILYVYAQGQKFTRHTWRSKSFRCLKCDILLCQESSETGRLIPFKKKKKERKIASCGGGAVEGKRAAEHDWAFYVFPTV